MKRLFLFLVIASPIFTGCSTAYRAAQTPDDVYYSPAKEAREEEPVAKRDRYQEYISDQDDRFLRMKVQDRNRWGAIDDYGYWYDSRYDYNTYNSNIYLGNRYAWNNWGYNTLGYGGGIFYPNYYGYNGYYSAVYPVVYYKNPKVYTGVTGKSNLSTYNNTRYSNQNSIYTKGTQPNGNFGNLVKRVFTNTNSNTNGNNNNSYDRPARTIEPSSTPSSSAGGRSGGYSSSGSSTSTPRPPRN